MDTIDKRVSVDVYPKEQPAAPKSQLHSPSAHWSSDSQKNSQNSAIRPTDLLYNTNSFCTVLNRTDISCCSRKKPDEFLRDLLFKLLKYCKKFLNNNTTSTGSSRQSESDPPSAGRNFIIDNRTDKNERLIDLRTAQRMYQCAEFKSILNESQELQHLNLYFLKTDNQKLSFFINLYNLLCIHSHFYLASIRVGAKSAEPNTTTEGEQQEPNPPIGFSFNLFHNRTERLLFQQRMCYKVGQMGSISLYDLKHLILMPRFLNNPNVGNVQVNSGGLSGGKPVKKSHSSE